MSNILSEKNNRLISNILKAICLIIAALTIVSFIIAVSGRVSVTGHGGRALLSSGASSYGFGLSVKLYDINFTGENVGASGLTRLLVGIMAAFKYLPLCLCFVFLSVFFKNIGSNEFFIDKNASLLFKSGICLLINAVPAAIINTFLIPFLINRLTKDRISLFSPLDITTLIFGFSLLAAAYVFSYGIYLQDEVDHTL